MPRAARRAARVLTLSELTKRDLVELYGVPEERIVVTPPGVDPVFTPNGPSPDGEPYLLFVGSLQPRKDPVAAIEALALLGDESPRLVLVGPDKGGRADAERAAERAGVASRVEFRGHVPLDELAALYRGAACLVFPSRYEGFGLPVLEAMASGTPVVATTAGALPEAAGDAAILVARAEPGRARRRNRARAGRPRAARRRGARARRPLHLGRDRAPHPRRLPGAAVSTVAAIVIWTPGDPDPAPCLDVARATGRRARPRREPRGRAVHRRRAPDRQREHPRLRREHQPRRRRNRARPSSSPPTPTSRRREGCIAALRDFADAHPRCGIAAPQLRYPDGRRQPSRRTFPTVRGTIVRRTPLRRLLKPQQRQRRHYLLDEHPTEPTLSDWLLGAFLFLRREMLEELGGFDEGYRLYGEEIDLAYRARHAGWERWYVPQAVAIHHHQAVTDKRFFTRRTLWHWRSILRFVRKHPECLKAL